jgi:hypothetical protein
MPEDIEVDKDKFDALLRKIANTPALKENERKIGPKPGELYWRRPGIKKKPTDKDK